ncbi:MAG: ABC transporter permease [Chloroflexi bacterium]|nr:ABC transporter permease [Chloroflexota bacterium]
MEKILTIARHEYWKTVRQTSFIAWTLIIPVLGLMGLIVAAFFSGQAADALISQVAPESQLGVLDQNGGFSPLLPDYEAEFELFDTRESGLAALADSRIAALVIIPEDYPQTGELAVISVDSSFGAATVGDSDQVEGFLLAHLLRDQVATDLQPRLSQPVSRVEVTNLGGEDLSADGVFETVYSLLVPYVLGILLGYTIFTASGYLLRSVSDEKTNRVIEIMLSSVTAEQLLAGKVIGLGAAGLTRVVIWLGSALLISQGSLALAGVNLPLLSQPMVLFLILVYYLLGYAIFSLLMAAAGALGTTLQEAGQIASAFSLIATMPPLLVIGFVFSNPDALVARILSYFPLTAPTMMMMRLTLAEIPLIDVIISIAVCLVTIPIVLWIGARVFQIGLLMTVKRPSLREIIQLMRVGSRKTAQRG